MRKIRILALVGVVTALSAGGVSAGPIILGGDDLNDHGFAAGGVNVNGWLYIQNALSALHAQVTLATPVGGFTVDIVELGDASDPALSAAAAAVGLSTTGYEGAAALSQFFADLAAGTVRPRILYSPGTDYGGASIDGSESAVLAANANAINDFVAAGGGLMSHGGANTTAYSYLTTLLPGIVMSFSCNSSGASLTAAGQAAFPQVTNADISAGPCHGSFSGSMGGLIPLALDGNGLNMIIGGVGGSITDPGTPVPEPASMLLLTTGFGYLAVRRRKSRR